MRHIVALICTILLAALPAQAETVRVMTWNPEFLWDGVAPEDGSSQVSFPWRGDAVAAAARMDRMARVIAGAAPDLLVLQEVEDAQALQALADLLPGYQAQFVQGRDTFTGQDVALLSRLPLQAVGRFDDVDPESGKGVSKNLVAFVQIGGRDLAVIGLHYLSRASDPSRRADREGQARATLAAMGKYQDRALIVLGDLNDYDGTVAHATSSETPVTGVLDLLKARGTRTRRDDLVNALGAFQDRLPQDQRWTSHWDRDGDDRISAGDAFTVIDHILVDPALRLVDATVLHLPEAAVSDHRPVVAVIEVE